MNPPKPHISSAGSGDMNEPGYVPRASARTITAVFLVLAVILYLVRDILLPFVIAGVVGYAASPLVDWISRKSRTPRWVGATVVFVALMTLVCGLGLLLAPPFIHEAERIAANLPQIVQNGVRRALGDHHLRLMGQDMTADQVAKRLLGVIQGAVSGAHAFLIGSIAAASLFGAIFTTVLLFYVLATGPQIGEGLLALVPPRQRGAVRLIWVELSPVLRRYFIGVAIVVAYASTAAYVGLGLFLDVRHAGLLALLTGILEMVPVIGPIAAAVIAGLVSLETASSLGNILAYAAYATLLRVSIDQFLGPIILGRAARVHPVAIMFSFLAGGLLFNISGVLLAVPVVIAVKVTLAAMYREPENLPDPTLIASHGRPSVQGRR